MNVDRLAHLLAWLGVLGGAFNWWQDCHEGRHLSGRVVAALLVLVLILSLDSQRRRRHRLERARTRALEDIARSPLPHLRDCDGNPCECGADPQRFKS